MTLSTGPSDLGGDIPSAAFSHVQVMRHRADFLRAARAARQGTTTMLVQARARGDDSPVTRIGYTCSKKLGNAVARNRAKRRLRHVAAEILPELGRPGWDYVLVGRFERTGHDPYDNLRRDLRYALQRLHQG